jgi:hypothetical protein
LLAKETGNWELFEVKEDLALDLQICEQLPYITPLFISNPSLNQRVSPGDGAGCHGQNHKHWT